MTMPKFWIEKVTAYGRATWKVSDGAGHVFARCDSSEDACIVADALTIAVRALSDRVGGPIIANPWQGG